MLLLVLLAVLPECACAVPLSNWRMQRGDLVAGGWSDSSLPSYDDSSWHNASVPGTVLGALVDAGLYPDVFRGQNIAAIDATQFDQPWVFKTSFSAAVGPAVLTIKGLSYRGAVFVNGVQVSDGELEGTFVYHDVSFSALESNGLAIVVHRDADQVFPPSSNSTDLGITFIDWSPLPPDHNMGLIRPVELSQSFNKTLLLRYPSISTSLNVDGSASVILSVELFNYGPVAINVGYIDAFIGDGLTSISPFGLLSAGKRVLVTFPAMLIDRPVLWWPWTLGKPVLYELQILEASGIKLVSRVGLRSIDSDRDANGNRYYSVNGQRIQVRGAGWANELFLRNQAQWSNTGLANARQLGLNTIRLEGQLLNEELFDLADEMGMLIIPGISCCDSWQHWKHWSQHTLDVAVDSIVSQVRRIRRHPSALAFWYSSDELPPYYVEKAYLEVFEAEVWPNPVLASASNLTSTLTGKTTGVKMSGPYQWVPPCFWLLARPTDTLQGGAFGFLSEGGPGAAPLTWESMQEAQKEVWPIDNADFMYHIANPVGLFGRDDYFSAPFWRRYGNTTSARDFARRTQAASYESYRAFMEAYNVKQASFLSWMLQSARPQHQWHLFEYNGLFPGAFFGAVAANADSHVILEPDSSSMFSIVSAYGYSLKGANVTANVYAADGALVWTGDAVIGSSFVARDILQIPITVKGLRFVELLLLRDGATVDRNVYWLPPVGQEDVFDFGTSDYGAPLRSYANLTGLSSLPPVTVALSNQVNQVNSTAVTLTNVAGGVAFFVRLRLVQSASGQDVLSATWSTNYVTLFPGQSVAVTVTHGSDIGDRLFEYEFF